MAPWSLFLQHQFSWPRLGQALLPHRGCRPTHVSRSAAGPPAPRASSGNPHVQPSLPPACSHPHTQFSTPPLSLCTLCSFPKGSLLGIIMETFFGPCCPRLSGFSVSTAGWLCSLFFSLVPGFLLQLPIGKAPALSPHSFKLTSGPCESSSLFLSQGLGGPQFNLWWD